MTKAERKAKIAAYDRYYLERFQADVKRNQDVLAASIARLEIAEQQFARGDMITGTVSGIPVLLERLYKK